MFYRHAFRGALTGVLAVATAAFFAPPSSAQVTSTQPAASSPGPGQLVNPAAAVPAVLYRSVFADTPVGVEAEQADWKKANAEVGQFKRGHVDVLKWEATHAEKDMAPVKAATQTVPPATKPQSTKP